MIYEDKYILMIYRFITKLVAAQKCNSTICKKITTYFLIHNCLHF